jgi:uncharacterized membrane protein YoaK (UPF0700 family)
MHRYDRRIRALAICLTALAGYVDAIGFMKLGGFFVSFMSGNSTRLAVGMAQGTGEATVAGSLIALFVAGVIIGSMTGHFAQARRREVVLALVAFLLAAAAILDSAGFPRFAVAGIVLAMGAENAVFEQDGEVRIGLTYMTGTLVKGGQRLAAALLGGDRWGWTSYMLQWAGLVIGATCGALVYPALGLGALWLAAFGMAVAALVPRPNGEREGPA